MSAEQFITEHLGLWTEAVTTKSVSGRGSNSKIELTGIKKLRALILSLAVQGKLVPQDLEDQPASMLLTQIAEYSDQLPASRKRKLSTRLNDISDDEKPFEIPNNWSFARLGLLFDIQDSKRVPLNTKERANRDGEYAYYGANGQLGTIDDFLFEGTRILVAEDGGFFSDPIRGVAYIADGKFWVNNHAHVLKCIGKTAAEFWVAYFNQLNWMPHVRGMTRAKLNQAAMRQIVMPVPPLAEQHRIVQKVDELMALCDRLEQQTHDQHAAHETLVDALLDTLTQSAYPDELAGNWTRLAAHFDTLFTTEHSIDRLKQAILELAVMGRLVPQDSTDEPATALLERIAEKKTSLTANGQIKKPKEHPPVADHENRFGLPLSWTWTRLGTIAQINPRNTADDETETSFVPMPLITSSYTGEHSQENKLWSDIKKGYTHFADGDIALAKITPCFENSKAAVFRNLHNGIGAGTTELHVARPYGATIDPLFILYCLKSPSFLTRGEARMTGTAGQKRLPKDFFAFDPIPLPPLAEQHRIVEKVEKLLTICDQLKFRLHKAGETRRQMANAVAEQAIH